MNRKEKDKAEKVTDKIEELLRPYNSDIRCDAIAMYLRNFADELGVMKGKWMNDAADNVSDCICE